METYLNYLDKLKESFIAKNNGISGKYFYSQFFYHQPITFIVDDGIMFCQSLHAVKLINTAVVFVDPINDTNVYFTDADIQSIITAIENPLLKKHLRDGLQCIARKNGMKTVYFRIHNRKFAIKGISFAPEFDHIQCDNPAGISLNGNDLIALINLVLEKERNDKNPNKRIETAKKYLVME